MFISGTQYSPNQKSYDIFLSGCLGDNGKHCKGCQQPELWNPNFGKPFEEEKDQMFNTLNVSSFLIDKIRIFGGEPLEKSKDELTELFKFLESFNKEIWIFTRFNLKKALKILDTNISFVSYIKCGGFNPELLCDNNIQYNVKLATSNQVIYKKGKDY